VTEEAAKRWLVNANIPIYASGNRSNHEPRRPRKLLLQSRPDQQADRASSVRAVPSCRAGLFQRARPAKIEIALRTGKQAHDKRQSIKTATGSASAHGC